MFKPVSWTGAVGDEETLQNRSPDILLNGHALWYFRRNGVAYLAVPFCSTLALPSE
jgi:hypothetical protein